MGITKRGHAWNIAGSTILGTLSGDCTSKWFAYVSRKDKEQKNKVKRKLKKNKTKNEIKSIKKNMKNMRKNRAKKRR